MLNIWREKTENTRKPITSSLQKKGELKTNKKENPGFKGKEKVYIRSRL